MRKKRKVGFLRIFRVIVIAAIFVGVLFFIVSIIQNSSWNGARRLTIVVDNDPIILFSIEPLSRQAILIIIPENTILDVPYGYGAYPAGVIYKLGNLDNLRGGGILLSKSIENTFSVFVENFWASKSGNKFSILTGQAGPTQKDRLLNFKNKYFSIAGLVPSLLNYQVNFSNIITNLSFLDTIRLWNAVRNLRNDRISLINLLESRVLKDEKLPDGTLVKRINKDELGFLISSNFQDRLVRLQNVSVEIVNATGKEKVAYEFSHILQNLGANVVANSTAGKDEKFNCKVFAFKKDILSSIIVERLTKFYKCESFEGKESSMTNIKVVLGEDFIK